jgi:hypothetical protein
MHSLENAPQKIACSRVQIWGGAVAAFCLLGNQLIPHGAAKTQIQWLFDHPSLHP